MYTFSNFNLDLIKIYTIAQQFPISINYTMTISTSLKISFFFILCLMFVSRRSHSSFININKLTGWSGVKERIVYDEHEQEYMDRLNVSKYNSLSILKIRSYLYFKGRERFFLISWNLWPTTGDLITKHVVLLAATYWVFWYHNHEIYRLFSPDALLPFYVHLRLVKDIASFRIVMI